MNADQQFNEVKAYNAKLKYQINNMRREKVRRAWHTPVMFAFWRVSGLTRSMSHADNLRAGVRRVGKGPDSAENRNGQEQSRACDTALPVMG